MSSQKRRRDDENQSPRPPSKAAKTKEPTPEKPSPPQSTTPAPSTTSRTPQPPTKEEREEVIAGLDDHLKYLLKFAIKERELWIDRELGPQYTSNFPIAYYDATVHARIQTYLNRHYDSNMLPLLEWHGESLTQTDEEVQEQKRKEDEEGLREVPTIMAALDKYIPALEQNLGQFNEGTVAALFGLDEALKLRKNGWEIMNPIYDDCGEWACYPGPLSEEDKPHSKNNAPRLYEKLAVFIYIAYSIVQALVEKRNVLYRAQKLPALANPDDRTTYPVEFKKREHSSEVSSVIVKEELAECQC